MRDIEITLSWPEILMAASVGCMRNVQDYKLGFADDAIAGKGINWSTNIEGAQGELAVAKHLGIFWSGAVGNLKARDVGGYQVKTNISRIWDDCIVREENEVDAVYIGVLSFMPKFIITGWQYGQEIKQQKFWRDGKKDKPAFFYPRRLLQPLATLPQLEKAA